MAIVPENICQASISEIQTELGARSECDVTLAEALFIFGLEDKSEGGTNQTNFQDAADWFDAQSWVPRIVINWRQQKIRLYNYLEA